MKNLLIVVDMQKDFINGSLGSKQGLAIVDNVCKEIGKSEYDTIVATLDTHYDNYMETYEGKNLPVAHCIKSTAGWRLNRKVASALKNAGSKKRFIKETFGSEKLVSWVKKNGKELESITLVGLCTDICVMSNAIMLRAAFPNLPIYVVEEACWATSQPKQEASFMILESNQIYRKEN